MFFKLRQFDTVKKGLGCSILAKAINNNNTTNITKYYVYGKTTKYTGGLFIIHQI